MAILLVALAVALGVGMMQAQETRGEVVRTEFDSATLQRPYRYAIYLPAGYGDSEGRYPVIYLLHGRGDDMESWLNVRNALDRMIDEGDVPPMIAVMPDAPSLERASYYVDTQYTGGASDGSGAQNDAVESAFFNDLIAHIDATYRTLERREGRLVGGYSMGGYGAIRYTTAHPQMFAGALVLSPAVYTPLPPIDSSAREFGAFGKDGELFDEEIYTRLNYPALLDSLAESGLGLAMFIAVGDDEYHNPNPYDWLHDIDLEAHLLYNRMVRVPNVSAELRVYDGGHDWIVWERGFIEGLAYLSRFIEAGE